MHTTIGFIVYAHSKEQAEKNRKKNMERLSCKECQTPFDGWSPLEVIEGMEFVPQVASTPAAGRVIGILMDWTRQRFFENLDEVRSRLTRATNEELYHERKLGDARFYMHEAGTYTGRGVYIYDNDGEGIREVSHLNDALEKWPSIKSGENRKRLDASGPPWVLLADAHY